MANRKIRDCDDLPSRDASDPGVGGGGPQQSVSPELQNGPAPLGRPRCPTIRGGARPFVARPDDKELPLLIAMSGHSLMKARVDGPDGRPVPGGSSVLFCTTCGGYSWGGLKSLGQTCPLRCVSADFKQQKASAGRGLFPAWSAQYRGWTIRSPCPASAFDMQVLGLSAGNLILPSWARGSGVATGGGSLGDMAERWEWDLAAARHGLSTAAIEEWATRIDEAERAAARARTARR